MAQTRPLYSSYESNDYDSHLIFCMNNSRKYYTNFCKIDDSFVAEKTGNSKYLQDSLLHAITETQRIQRAFGSLEACYFPEIRLNPSNPSMLLNFTLALELQKTLSCFQTKIDIFGIFPLFPVRPCRYLIADSINNAFKSNNKIQASVFQVISLTLEII